MDSENELPRSDSGAGLFWLIIKTVLFVTFGVGLLAGIALAQIGP